MAMEGALSFSAASLVEDVLQQHGIRSRDLDLESRRAGEAATRRYEAAGWLRKMVGVVGAKDLPAEPSEDEFRLGLRSGLILCNVINKVQPGAVPKVVESPCDSTLIPDGAALSAYQYFENVRNFLVAVQEMGLPTFEASDLEQGGKSARIVNCVLALKSYSDWKQTGGNGVWKFGGNVKPTTSVKPFVRKTSEPFTNSLSRNLSTSEKSLNTISHDLDSNNKPNSSLSMLVRAVLLDKKPDEVPTLVESVLNKVVEEFEHRISSQVELKKTSPKDLATSQRNASLLKHASGDLKIEDKNVARIKMEQCFRKNNSDEESKKQLLKQKTIFDQQERDIKELKQTLHTTKAGMQFMQKKVHEEMQNLGVHIYGLAHAASGYHKVLEENRKLYNQVQDLKGSIRVYCRVRPFLPGQSNYSSSVDCIEEGTITINTPSKYGKGRRSFNFNKVFGPSATQGEVFSDTQQLIRSVLDGYNVCIFAYGQTGSGKTFTMTGPKELTEQNKGVNYRALGDLFLLAEQRKSTFRYDVSVQMIEIYNEQVRDLLVTDGLNKRLEIRNSSQTGLNVPDASLVQVKSTSDVIDLMNIGQRNRAVGATALNDRSSRSHSCLTVHVHGRDLTSGTILRGCMHLVDLAGSERVDKSEVTGDRLKEAQHINKSLSALGDVISSLAQKNSHVPYRNSKLTQLLQDSLGGQAKTLMFVHISPESDALGETISTLKFAERVATVELGAARINKDSADVKELKEQIASLRAALTRKEGAMEPMQHAVSGSPCSIVSSPSYPQGGDMLADHTSHRKPMGDVGNIEVRNNSTLRQKMKSFDLDELLGNSPPWPPVSNTDQIYGEDDKEMGSGEWVDKVMVNKQDALRGNGNPLGCWEADNGHMSDIFYQKYLSDSSKIYPEQSYNIFAGNNQFDIATSDYLDEIDAGTSDSSEPDLLWQFNHAKLTSITNAVGSRTQKSNSKPAKSPELSRNMVPKVGPSPSRKQSNGVGTPLQRNGRQTPAEMKRKAGNRK
ncbi:kinesin-like protein KIN-14I isoform X2 [Cornus florida]|uniref:kinesin-like protein KIN-14I isoform X2 n=1 Tax=Cornus florida TaxID=4283 RepID=UPI0028989008|nr:kinesin-like protein KIN-14I isoform X2 [Cornus florida]